MTPVVNGLKEAYNGKVMFNSLNATQDGQEAFEQLNLPGHPAVLVFDVQHQEVYRGFGVIPEEELRATLDQVSAGVSP